MENEITAPIVGHGRGAGRVRGRLDRHRRHHRRHQVEPCRPRSSSGRASSAPRSPTGWSGRAGRSRSSTASSPATRARSPAARRACCASPTGRTTSTRRSAWRARELWRELGEGVLVEAGVVWFARARRRLGGGQRARCCAPQGIPVERLDPGELERLFPSLGIDDLGSACSSRRPGCCAPAMACGRWSRGRARAGCGSSGARRRPRGRAAPGRRAPARGGPRDLGLRRLARRSVPRARRSCASRARRWCSSTPAAGVGVAAGARLGRLRREPSTATA